MSSSASGPRPGAAPQIWTRVPCAAGATALAPIRLGVPPTASLWSAGNPNCGPARKLLMRRFLSCEGLGAPIAPSSQENPDNACGELGSVIARVTREAPPLWPSQSSGRALACPPAQPPVGQMAVLATAGCSKPGGALANATPAAESCLVPPGVTGISIPVPPGADRCGSLMGRAPGPRGSSTTSAARHLPAATHGAGGVPLGSEAN